MRVNDPILDTDLIERLRKQGSIWFKNEDMLLLEELIRRYQFLRANNANAR